MNRRTVFYWLIGIVIAAIVIATAFYFDDAVRDFIAQHQNRVARNFMRDVSKFGDWPEHVALGLLLAAAAWFRNSKKWTRVFLSMLIALAIAGLAGRVIKISTGRATLSENGRGLERTALQLKISCLPIGTRCRLDRILCRFISRELAHRSDLRTDSNLDWLLPNVCRGALFVRRGVRGGAWPALRDSCCSLVVANIKHQTSNMEHVAWRRG